VSCSHLFLVKTGGVFYLFGLLITMKGLPVSSFCLLLRMLVTAFVRANTLCINVLGEIAPLTSIA